MCVWVKKQIPIATTFYTYYLLDPRLRYLVILIIIYVSMNTGQVTIKRNTRESLSQEKDYNYGKGRGASAKKKWPRCYTNSVQPKTGEPQDKNM